MLIHKMKVAVGVCLSALTMGFVAHAMLVDNPNRFEKALRGHVVEVRHGAGRTMTVTLDEFDVPLNLDVAPNAKTTLAFAASDFADVRPGMYVALRLAADHRTVSEIDVMGAVHEGRLTRYDPASRRLSIETIPDDDDAPPRTETFDVAPDVIARIDEIQGRADDLEAGQPISVELAKDGKTVNAVSARWRTESDVEAVLESYEPATRTATLFVDQEDVVVRQQIVLAKDIRLFVDGVPATESDLQPNLFLVIRMAPDQKSATAIRGRKPVVEIEDDDDDEKSDGTDDSATAEDAAESVPPERDDDFQPDVEDDA